MPTFNNLEIVYISSVIYLEMLFNINKTCFITRKETIMLEIFMNLENNILLFIQESLRSPILTPVFLLITKSGDNGQIWIFISLLLLLNKKTRPIGCMSICALIGSYLINNMILKNLVGRIRPYEAIQGLIPLIPKPGDFSFPSGHTASSFAAAGILYRKLPKRFGIPAVILAGLIGFSRMYLGVHYPTDVLFGMISGIGISYLAEILVNYIGEIIMIRDRR